MCISLIIISISPEKHIGCHYSLPQLPLNIKAQQETSEESLDYVDLTLSFKVHQNAIKLLKWAPIFPVRVHLLQWHPPSLAPLTPLSSLHCPLTNKDTQKSTPQKTPSYNLPWKNVKEIFPLSRSCHPQSLQSACGMQLRDKHRHTHTHTHTKQQDIHEAQWEFCLTGGPSQEALTTRTRSQTWTQEPCFFRGAGMAVFSRSYLRRASPRNAKSDGTVTVPRCDLCKQAQSSWV